MSRCENTGVYKILCAITGSYYIGVSKNIARRWNEHRRALRQGTHHSLKLQKDYDKYGPDAFVFVVIKYCDYAEAKAIEEATIEVEKPIYNAYTNGDTLNSRIKEKSTAFERKLIEALNSYGSTNDKDYTAIDITTLAKKCKIKVTDILNYLNVNEHGFNSFVCIECEPSLYIGTLTTDEDVYVVLSKEEIE